MAAGQQDRAGTMVRQVRAQDRAHAHCLPVGDRFHHPLGRLVIVEAIGQLHLYPPGLALGPAPVPQVIRGGGQRVGGVVAPKVALAVAVEIDRELLPAGRHELRMPRGPGPGAGEAVHVAAVDYLQCGDQLGLKEGAAPPLIGEGGKRAEHGQVAPVGAIGAFQAPDGGEDLFLDAILRLDPVQQCLMPVKGLQAKGDAILGDGGVEIVPDGLGELVLVAVAFNDLGVECDPPQRRVEGGGWNARCQCPRPEVLNPGVQPGLRSHLTLHPCHGIGQDRLSLDQASAKAQSHAKAGRHQNPSKDFANLFEKICRACHRRLRTRRRFAAAWAGLRG